MKSRKSLLVIALPLLICSYSLSAQNTLDSLRQKLVQTQGAEKYAAYGDISWYYMRKTQLDSATMYADSIRLVGQRLKDQNGIRFSDFYYGVVSRLKGRHTAALDHLIQYRDYFKSVGDSIKVARASFQIASVNTNIANYEKSLKAYYRALKINEQEQDQRIINLTLNGIAIVFKSLKRYDEALKTYEKVLRTDSLNSDVLLNIGNVHLDQGNLELAEPYYLKALEVDKNKANDWAVAYDFENLGTLYGEMYQYPKALAYHIRALELRQKLPNKVEEGNSLRGVGWVHLKMGNYAEAEEFLTKALAIGQKTGTKSLTRDSHRYLSVLYFETKDFEAAYSSLKSFSKLNDSLIGEQSVKQVNKLKEKYESEKKDQQITLLATENERQSMLKNAMIVGILATILIAAMWLYILWIRLKNQKILASKNEEVKESNFKRQLTELEMKALQAQINPHFIFNCMNSINQMIKNKNNEDASKYLTKFSKLIRLILENAEDSEVSLKDELSTLKSYIELEALRFKENINFEIEVQEDIDLENTYLPSMVLQPFVENAIWHGLRHKKQLANGKIAIGITQEQDELVCLIEDNGVGRRKAFELQQKSVLKRKSLGLKITEDRLRLLSKELKKQLINITDLTDQAGKALGTRVKVNIPIS